LRRTQHQHPQCEEDGKEGWYRSWHVITWREA
jgi:hypothetical protein